MLTSLQFYTFYINVSMALPSESHQKILISVQYATHKTINIQHSTFNIQHSTFNIQHSTFNIQRKILAASFIAVEPVIGL